MLVPPGVVTVTSTGPAETDGEIAVIAVSEAIVKPDDGTAPKLTAVAPVNPLPAIVTLVPPVAGPETVEMPVTRGAGTNVSLSVSQAPLATLKISLPCASNAEKAGSRPVGAAGSTVDDTTEPVKSQVTAAHAE